MNRIYSIAGVVLGACALIGVVAAAAFGAFDGESSATAKKNFCNSLTNLSSTVMSYEGMNPATASNDELDAAYDDIASAWNSVVDDANDWANAYDNPLTNAYDDLYWAEQALPGDYTVAQDLDALQPQLSAFPQAYQATFDGSGCSAV